MSANDLKPMEFTAIGNGNYAKMMQQNFLKASAIASQYNQKVEIVSKITIFPPDPRMPEFGNLTFSVQLKEQPYAVVCLFLMVKVKLMQHNLTLSNLLLRIM